MGVEVSWCTITRRPLESSNLSKLTIVGKSTGMVVLVVLVVLVEALKRFVLKGPSSAHSHIRRSAHHFSPAHNALCLEIELHELAVSSYNHFYAEPGVLQLGFQLRHVLVEHLIDRENNVPFADAHRLGRRALGHIAHEDLPFDIIQLD